MNDLVSRIRQVESAGKMAAVGPYIPGQGTAKSDMQVMDATNLDPGFGVRPAANNSLEERSRVGRDYVAAMFKRYGNEADAAAAYNWGPGNFDDWVKAGRDPTKMPKETREYIDKVVAGPKEAYRKRIEQGVKDSILQPPTQAASMQRLLAARAEQEAAEANRPSFLEMAGAALSGNTTARIVGPITEAIFGEEFPPVPGYVPDMSKLSNTGADQEWFDDYAAARSPQEAEKVLQDLQDDQLRRATVMDRGTATGLGMSFGAEILDPTNWAAAWAAPQVLAARGLGSAALAAKGASKAQVMAASVGENLLSGTALEATAQLVDGRFNGTDLVVSAVADAALGVAAGGLNIRAVKQAEQLIERARASGLDQETAKVLRAVEELGPDATTEQIKKVVANYDKVAVTEPVVNTPLYAPSLDSATDMHKVGYATQHTEYYTSDKGYAQLADQYGMTDLPAAAPDRAAAIKALAVNGPSVYLPTALRSDAKWTKLADDLEVLRKQFLPDVTLHLTADRGGLEANAGANTGGAHTVLDTATSLIVVHPSNQAASRTIVHEFGHAIFTHRLNQLSRDRQGELADAWLKWNEDPFTDKVDSAGAAMRRSPITAALNDPAMKLAMENRLTETFGSAQSLRSMWEKVFPTKKEAREFAGYFGNFDEYAAEQFSKYVESEALGLGEGNLTLPQRIVVAFSRIVNELAQLLGIAKKRGLVQADLPFAKFFDELLAGNKSMGLSPLTTPVVRTGESPTLAPLTTIPDVVASILTNQDVARLGLNVAPVATKAQRDDAKAILALHLKAERDGPAMTADHMARVKNLADNSVINVASAGLIMLRSNSPLMRWVASELLEDASGVQAKRGTTAAIKKHLMERMMMGNTINDIENAYSIWKKDKPGGLKDDLIGGKNRAAFDRAIAEEIEIRGRIPGWPGNQDANVRAAADSIEAAYTRIAKAQKDANTLGAGGLPDSSRGYMPHRMSASALIGLSNEKRSILHQTLVDQFVKIEGWDPSFSDMLASKYMQRIMDRATGGNGSPIGGNGTTATNLVEEALTQMGLPEDAIKKHMDSFKKGSPGYTKGRVDLDLNKVYSTAEGDFRLLDVFETNQIELLRSQTQRASGEVALALKGVQGKPGLDLIRKAMQYGEDGKRPTPDELEAFDQIAAELMGEPFGTATPRWMERAMSANTLVRLGGIVFNQIAESINGIVHVGATRVFESVTGIPRLRQEILALARGEKVDNPIIGSIELAGGAEFGTDSYKIVMPYDNPTNTMPTYGQDTLTLTDRLLRGGGHLQSKLSGWRAIHSAQQRGMAEQIVHKALRYIREGKDDVALRDFGISPELQAAMRAELDQVAKFDGDRLVQFDVTKLSDQAMREQFIQAVWRGTSQIIQGTYIGERGKWAHDGTMKLLTQFRTFSITSMEKQWGRQRNQRGAAAAFGIVLGAMSLAAPIYMARTYLASIGRPDQEAFLEERLDPQMVARATMNYVAGVGMMGDFVDALSATLPEDLGVKPTGGRAGVETTFVGNYIAPASSLVDDVWKYAQSPLELQDAAKILPMSRLPYLIPLMNQTREE